MLPKSSNKSKSRITPEIIWNKGVENFSDAEVLSYLLTIHHSCPLSKIDLADSILSSFDNNLSALSKLNKFELRKIPYVSEHNASAIQAAFELGRRRLISCQKPMPIIRSSQDCFNILEPYLIDLPHEEFWVLYLNQANAVKRCIRISSGGISGTIVDQRIIFKHAIELHASYIILSHNHPSGNLKPSLSDLDLTKKMVQSGKLLDIKVLDHILIGDGQTKDGQTKYFSFADNGLL